MSVINSFRLLVLKGGMLSVLMVLGLPLLPGPVRPASPASGPVITILSTNVADYPGGAVPRFNKFEITFNLSTTYSNPYDPDEIQVDGYFTSPGQDTSIQPGFYYQDYEVTSVGGIETYTPSGDPVWKVRFSPSQLGTYQYYLRANDQNGVSTTIIYTFNVVASEIPGFINVSETNPRYFEFDNGAPFIGFGLNVASWAGERRRISTYEYYINRMGENKANLARVWMTNSGREQNWILSIQDSELGSDYNLEEAWAFDNILDLAFQKGVYFLLTLDDVNQYTYNWPDNLYNSARGGPCTYRSAIFTDPQARVFQERIFRYIVARWGYSPNILSWELFNEIDELQWSDLSHWNWQALLNWHAGMADYLDTIDAHHHLINTSTGSFKLYPDLYGLAQMDHAQIHFYYVPGCCDYAPSDPAGRDIANLTRYYAYRLYNSVEGKPGLIGEFGLLGADWSPSPLPDADDQGVHLHNGLWSALMSGMAATGLSWHWDFHHSNDPAWWRHYAALAGYFEDLSTTNLTVLKPLNVDFSLPGGDDSRADVFTSTNPQLRVMGLSNGFGVYAWVQNKNHTWWNYTQNIAVAPQSGTLTVRNLTPSGLYILEKWDTYSPTHQIISQESVIAQPDGSLEINIVSLQNDLAFKLRRVLAPQVWLPALSR
jgi:hypothetical protein